MTMDAIYADYNATTPIDPRVFEAMREWYLGPPANAGSRTHIYGQRAKEAVERSRTQVAELLSAEPDEIIFTSGATESNNLAILGLVALGERTGRKHIISTAIEHKAVLEPLDYLRKRGFAVEIAPVASAGFVEAEEVRKRLRPDTLLVSVMHANNETGVLQPVTEIGDLLAGTETFFHSDIAQTFGKEVETLRRLKCDLLSISGHKIYGPQGIGALMVRRRGAARRQLEPVMYGGGQERGLRPGTVPVPLVIALGEASAIAQVEYAERNAIASKVKLQLLAALATVEHQVNGDPTHSLPHVLNVSFSGVDSEALMMQLREVLAISNGSACTSASYNPSHVLLAMGMDADRISESVRISWGPDVQIIPAQAVVDAVERLRVRF